MHETETGRAVANPRRTRLGADWTAKSTGAVDQPQPTSGPTPGAGAEARSLG
ncbi:hypothetical protein [Saccharothrix yanglingensis]|uniref:hypothetical protein n=1 Tax=Saccharothrix yanglingensis TaxID=659496 RepID=UPI0027D265CC|nr:hypothetical protein [Saccharothrix yanglingensis]